MIDATIDAVIDAPDANPVWRNGHPFRRCRVRRFPYVIFYSVEPSGVQVVAFAHTKRKPGYWLSRSAPR